MSDELNNKIKQLTELLSQENLPENLMGILSLLGGQSGKEDSSPKANEQKEKNQEKHEKQNSSHHPDNTEMLNSLMRTINANMANDPRINLLSALKPFMSKRRQKNINNCINIIRMSKLANILDNSNKIDY
ncbi:MAG TPA: hypothetical protein GXX20_03640 [Clostridiaceae bacterium]|nr:hypothetical protein [Clostridiaceae bacterium]